MRSIISLLLTIASISALAQRIEFEDPDLTFSFKKPKGWEVFDDGYVVKISPSVSDSSKTFLTITYFEDAKSYGGPYPSEPSSDSENLRNGKIKIDGEHTSYSEKEENGVKLMSYTFYKYAQRFEINTSYITSDESNNYRLFQKIIRSIRIKK